MVHLAWKESSTGVHPSTRISSGRACGMHSCMVISRISRVWWLKAVEWGHDLPPMPFD